jgi:hypothetical protein
METMEPRRPSLGQPVKCFAGEDHLLINVNGDQMARLRQHKTRRRQPAASDFRGQTLNLVTDEARHWHM